MTFHNSADFPAPRDALISLTRSDTADDAAPSLVSLLFALGPQIPLDYGDWAIGDATGVRLVTTDVTDRGQIHVYYEFNVEHITSLVEVHGSQDEVSEIDAQALEFAQAEESWLRKCFAARAQSLQ